MATCSSLTEHSFDSYSDYRLAVAQIITAAQHELLLCEQDFSQSGINSKPIQDALWDFLTSNPSAQLRLIAFNPNYLSKNCPQFLQLTNQFGHQIKMQLADESSNHWQQGFILADRRHVLRRYHFAWPRGEISADASYVAKLQQQFQLLWERATPCNEWQRLYL